MKKQIHNPKLFIIAVIALREAKFWSSTVSSDEFENKNILFISFCSVASKYLEKQGHECFCIFNSKSSFRSLEKISKRKVNDPIFLHESLTFANSKKFVWKKYKKLHDKIYTFLKLFLDKRAFPIDSIFVIQELGAFAPVIALFDACQNLKINHFFCEPSIIPGHTFLLKNTLDFKPIDSLEISKKLLEFKKFCFQISNSNPLAFKDVENLSSNSLTSYGLFFKKVLNKLIIIFSPNLNTYYNALIPSIFQRLNRFISDIILKLLMPRYKKNNSKINKFIYYPLHSDIDFALTVRNPDYLDQYKNLINLLRKSNVVIKQHPTRGYTFKIIELINIFFKNIFSKNKVFLAKASMHSILISSNAEATYFITSKAGIFAKIMNLETISPIKLPFNDKVPEKFYEEIGDKSFPFDLYNFSEDNLNLVRKCILKLIN